MVHGFDEEQHRGKEQDREADGENIHATSLRPPPSSQCEEIPARIKIV